MRFWNVVLRSMLGLGTGAIIGLAIHATNLAGPPRTQPTAPNSSTPESTKSKSGPDKLKSNGPPSATTTAASDEVILDFMKRELESRLAGDEAQANQIRQELRHYMDNLKE